MNEPELILVYILSVFLAVFLLLSIYIAVKVIQILKALERITEKAEHIADKAENLSDIFVKSSGPVAFGKFIAHITDTVFRKHKTDRED